MKPCRLPISAMRAAMSPAVPPPATPVLASSVMRLKACAVCVPAIAGPQSVAELVEPVLVAVERQRRGPGEQDAREINADRALRRGRTGQLGEYLGRVVPILLAPVDIGAQPRGIDAVIVLQQRERIRDLVDVGQGAGAQLLALACEVGRNIAADVDVERGDRGIGLPIR